MPDNTPDNKYTVTVYAAAPGTPLLLESPATSGPGHMYYTTSDGHSQQSYGFAPIKHGDIDGPGKIYSDDVRNYDKPYYSRTMEVSKEQYDKLNEFGKDPAKYGFDMNYKDVRNNCVDFAWGGLNHAGIERHNHVDMPIAGPLGPDVRVSLPGTGEGKSAFRPAENVDDIRSIKDPIHGSPLNKEHTNPMPPRTVMQRLLSENEQPKRLDDSTHPDNAMYQQARNGVNQLDAEHGRAPNQHSDNLAGSLTVAARDAGMNRIDHVVLSDDASRAWAVQGDLRSPFKQYTSVGTEQGLNTSIAQSSATWDQNTQRSAQGQAQTQAQTQIPTQAQPQQQPAQAVAQAQAQMPAAPSQPQGPVMRA